MPFKYAPGCNCCEVTCLIGSDDFDGDLSKWTEEAGEWTVASSILTTTSADGLLLFNSPAHAAEQWLTVKIKASTDGDCVRVCLGYDSADEFAYVEFQFGGSTDGAGFMRFGQNTVTGGAETLGPDVPIFTVLDAWYTLFVCLHAGVITARWRDVTTFPYGAPLDLYQYRDTTAAGNQAGLGTGALAGTASFDTFSLESHRH
jgi:hypothetical protein